MKVGTPQTKSVFKQCRCVLVYVKPILKRLSEVDKDHAIKLKLDTTT